MKLLKNLRWIAVWTATWTMLATPVAMGQEAKRVSKSQMQSVVDELGLNKQITIGEFYQKNKALLPDRIKKEIEPFFMANKNMMMPTFEVISSKTTSGDEIPTLRVSQNGELINIQWFGEKNRLMKFQNTNLTEVDIVNFNDMFTRIAAGDEKFRKQAEPVKSNLKKTTAAIRSFKYPDVTKEQWKTMTPRDRASYVVTLRTLHADALKVLALKPALKSKAKKKKYSFIDSHPYFSALFSYQEVQAASYFTAKSCVVAGYLSTYERREDGHEVCSTSKIISSRTEDTLFGKAKEQCGPDQIPCNPAIYGAPNGKPTCLTPSVTDAEFQTATHFAGKCDTDSRLQTDTAEVAFLNDPTKTSGRYNSDNFKLPDKEREEYFKTQQGANFQKTEEYLLGLLKLKGLVGADKTKLDDSVMNDTIRSEIASIKLKFDDDIKKAVQQCHEVNATSDRTESAYLPACDQLHRRFLFVQEWNDKRCADQGLASASNSLACTCAGSAPSAPAPAASNPAPAASQPAPVVTASVPSPAASQPAPVASAPVSVPVTVPPGASCPQPPAGTVVAPPAVNPLNPGGQACDAIPSDDKCSCPGGGHPTADVVGAGNRQTSYSCANSGNNNNKYDKDKNECGFFCKMWKGVKTIAPFAIAGVAAYFIFKKLAPKKPSMSPAADLCPGSSTPPPCAQTCTPPLKLQSTGACSCDGCPPGQTADATCTCSSAPSGGTTPVTILCPDSVTRAADLNACPDYPCWNGTSYKNPMNCPAAPSSTTNSVNTGN